MPLRGGGSYHHIWTIEDGLVRKVLNMDALGTPKPKYKSLKKIFQSANSLEELTLSQLKKKDASEFVILTTEAECDASSLNKSLCKSRVKTSKSSRFLKVYANQTSSTSKQREDDMTVNINHEDPEEEFIESNQVHKRGEPESCTNDLGQCELNQASFDSLDDNKFMKMDNKESISNVKQSASDCFQCQDGQQTSEDINYSSDVHNSISNPEIVDEQSKDMVSMEPGSSINVETTNLASAEIDGSLISMDIATHQVMLSSAPPNADSETKVDNNDQNYSLKPERIPLTGKFILPNSQEKLCQAMISVERLDNINDYKCKEKLYFEEQAENMFLLPKSNVVDNELNDQNFVQNKAVISSKNVLKSPKENKNRSPNKDIEFLQRQMHDMESLSSKLISELKSMKKLVQKKMAAYRSPSLENEVQSAINSAKETEKIARKRLSRMATDCNRFCKIMKLIEDNNTSASSDPSLEKTNLKKPLEREKKKICFADEAGGTLCHIKVYQTEP